MSGYGGGGRATACVTSHHRLLVDVFDHGLFRFQIEFLVELQIGDQHEAPFDKVSHVGIRLAGVEHVFLTVQLEV